MWNTYWIYLKNKAINNEKCCKINKQADSEMLIWHWLPKTAKINSLSALKKYFIEEFVTRNTWIWWQIVDWACFKGWNKPKWI